ncbi:MAG TPA: hypothetical protein VME41_12480 [Stellaceae bacterium]|nr:hypothetical protein [Stellaceae bacterium]
MRKLLQSLAAAAVVLLACAAFPSPSGAQVTPQIWFHPPDPVHRRAFAHESDPEYVKLFEPGAPWQQAAAHVRILKIYTKYLLEGNEADLRAQFAWLKQHHIGLALEGPIIVTGSSACGTKSEGYSTNGLAPSVIKKLRLLGAEPDYWTADEPLFFGHSTTPRPGFDPCQLPIPKLAALAGSFTRQIRAAFPRIQFIDIEPASNFPQANWPALMGPWLNAYRHAAGAPFAAVIMDVAWWVKGWQQRALSLTQYLRSARVPTGVIYDGNSPEKSNRAWLAEARQHWRQYESLVGGPPDIALFQSWAPQPVKLLPETSTDAFTNVVLDYARAH